MKLRLLIVFCFLSLTCAYGQKFEFSLQANAGAYSYSGISATGTSFFNSNGTGGYYTNNIYGNKSGFSYGASAQLQHLARGGFMVGLQAGYYWLRSYENINQVYPPVFYLAADDYGPEGFAYNPIPVKGHATLQSYSIDLSPFVGYRVKLNKKMHLDLMPGADIAFSTSAYDKGTATDAQNITYRTNRKMTDAPTDFRLKFGTAIGYKRWIITASYAHGLTNLDKDINVTSYGGGAPIVHSELLLFGVGYVLGR